jgi:methenyltetrahydrofolate cyclohydrolase
MSYLDSPLKNYLDDLAAKLPAPGGGSAAALASALGAALNSMVLNFTAGNEKFKAVEKEAGNFLARSEEIRNELTGLVQKDVDAYSKVGTAYKMPRNGDSEKQARSAAIQSALKEAVQIPRRIMELSFAVTQLCRDILPVGNLNLISDIAVAAVLAEAGMEAGFVNVEINLASITDLKFNDHLRSGIEPLIREGSEIKKQVWNEVFRRIKG